MSGNMVSVNILENKIKLSPFYLAYYPVYENRRNEYVDNFWRIVNWSFVESLFTQGTARHSDL